TNSQTHKFTDTQINNPTIQQSNNLVIQQSNNPTIQQSNNPTIQQSNNPAIVNLPNCRNGHMFYFKITRIGYKAHFVGFAMQFVGLFNHGAVRDFSFWMEGDLGKLAASVFGFFHYSCGVVNIFNDSNLVC